MEKYVRTTMIGAIHAIEKRFEAEMTQEAFKEKFIELRKEILDLGNSQIRLYRKEKG